jgi:hypothetical protein
MPWQRHQIIAAAHLWGKFPHCDDSDAMITCGDLVIEGVLRNEADGFVPTDPMQLDALTKRVLQVQIDHA